VWSTDRIARLPREIRERGLSACGPQARAGHYFATYDPHSDAIHLDYSLLECPDLSSFGGGISGLHQTFVRLHGYSGIAAAQICNNVGHQASGDECYVGTDAHDAAAAIRQERDVAHAEVERIKRLTPAGDHCFSRHGEHHAARASVEQTYARETL
jgi:hypothetical protein